MQTLLSQATFHQGRTTLHLVFGLLTMISITFILHTPFRNHCGGYNLSLLATPVSDRKLSLERQPPTPYQYQLTNRMQTRVCPTRLLRTDCYI
jgi:hypothetical protein